MPANPYSIRSASAKDLETLIRHRRSMFEEMGVKGDYARMEQALRDWIPGAMEGEIFFAWLAETPAKEVVGGGAVLLLPNQPSPVDANSVRALIYNIWTDLPHRRKGIAREIMERIHTWCHKMEITTISLHASDFGRPLYASLGYAATNEMRFRFP